MTEQTLKDESLWNAAQVAAFLGVPLSWVYERTARDEIPCRRLSPRNIRFVPSVIREWATKAH